MTISDITDDTLMVERREDVDWVTLNRPHKHNALDPGLLEGLCSYLERAATDTDLRVIVIRGSGQSFCAGLHLSAQLAGGGRDTRRILDLMPLLRACPQPVVTLLHGAVKGGGFVMALASDIRIAGESARMDDTFVNLGLSGCDVGISYFLPRMVGLSVASELMLTGRVIDAQRALHLGLVSEVVPDDQMETAAARVTAEFRVKSALGLQRTKEMLSRALAIDDLLEVIRTEIDIQLEVQSKDPTFSSRLATYGNKP